MKKKNLSKFSEDSFFISKKQNLSNFSISDKILSRIKNDNISNFKSNRIISKSSLKSKMNDHDSICLEINQRLFDFKKLIPKRNSAKSVEHQKQANLENLTNYKNKIKILNC